MWAALSTNLFIRGSDGPDAQGVGTRFCLTEDKSVPEEKPQRGTQKHSGTQGSRGKWACEEVPGRSPEVQGGRWDSARRSESARRSFTQTALTSPAQSWGQRCSRGLILPEVFELLACGARWGRKRKTRGAAARPGPWLYRAQKQLHLEAGPTGLSCALIGRRSVARVSCPPPRGRGVAWAFVGPPHQFLSASARDVISRDLCL